MLSSVIVVIWAPVVVGQIFFISRKPLQVWPSSITRHRKLGFYLALFFATGCLKWISFFPHTRAFDNSVGKAAVVGLEIALKFIEFPSLRVWSLLVGRARLRLDSEREAGVNFFSRFLEPTVQQANELRIGRSMGTSHGNHGWFSVNYELERISRGKYWIFVSETGRRGRFPFRKSMRLEIYFFLVRMVSYWELWIGLLKEDNSKGCNIFPYLFPTKTIDIRAWSFQFSFLFCQYTYQKLGSRDLQTSKFNFLSILKGCTN